MPRLTDEQIESAREVDLLSYLSAREPHELKRTGACEYRTVTHSSLVITPGYWYWNKGAVGGPSALDYLIKVRGIPFIEAVRDLLDTGLAREPISFPITPRARATPVKAEFKLPYADRYGRLMVAYLQDRGIHPDIIRQCVQDGLLFESRYRSEPVCVFIGRDDDGKARFAALRGIGSDIKKDVAGSDKQYSFTLPASNPESRCLFVFEASIDALSHATLSMRCGFERGDWRLSLGGTSSVALTAFLSRHSEISRIVLHMDNDRAGIENARRIRSMLNTDGRFSHIHVSINPARGGKDFNERLMRTISQSREQAARTKAAISAKEEL